MVRKIQPPRDNTNLDETLELLGTVVASMSDRLDELTTNVDRLTKTAAETRAAAFHAKSQSDPKPVALAIANSIDQAMGPVEGELRDLRQRIDKGEAITRGRIEELLNPYRAQIEARRRFLTMPSGRTTFAWARLLAGAIVLAVLTTLVAPRLLGVTPTGCTVLGGIWHETTTFCAVSR